MTAIFELTATFRETIGTGASRRLRRTTQFVPGIVYGGKEAPMPISLERNKLSKAIEHEAFYSHILTLTIEGKKQKVVLKDLQREHAKKTVMHLDFQRVSDTDKITMHVPLHFINADICPGAKAGGIISHQLIDVEIRCQARHLPEFIEVDLSNLNLDEAIHLSELSLPQGVEIPALSHDRERTNLAVVSVHLARAMKIEDEQPVAETVLTEVKEATEKKEAPKETKPSGNKEKKDKGK